MTAYKKLQTAQPTTKSARVQEANAKRQAVLDRVRKQRAAAQKRTVQEWIQEGMIIRASALKKRYSLT